jgi:hypothetical protein
MMAGGRKSFFFGVFRICIGGDLENHFHAA